MIVIDINEPPDLELLIQQSMLTMRAPANMAGLGDYSWMDCLYRMVSVERKTAMEILSNMDAVEEQLGREMEKCEDLTLLIEGGIVPDGAGSAALLWSESGISTRPSRIRTYEHTSFAKYASWIWQLAKAGVPV